MARTPTRNGEECKSYSNSPIGKHEPMVEITRAFPAEPTPINLVKEISDMPITWPSRVVTAS